MDPEDVNAGKQSLVFNHPESEGYRLALTVWVSS